MRGVSGKVFYARCFGQGVLCEAFRARCFMRGVSGEAFQAMLPLRGNGCEGALDSYRTSSSHNN